MSNEAITWAFKQAGLTATEKFVLVALADYADDEHTCFPAHQKTADRVSASKSTVQRAIKSLEAKGRLRVIPGKRANGSATTNRYLLNVHGQIDHAGVSGDTRGGYVDDQGGVVTVTIGGSHSDHRAMVTRDHPLTPSVYPPIEPPVEPTHQRLDIETLREDDFDRWWSMYPVKVGKATARKAYRKAALRHDDLAGKLQAYLEHRARYEGQGWLPNLPHPTTWLNQERWEDRPIPTTDSYRPTAEQRFHHTIEMGRQLMATHPQGELE